MNHIEMLNKAKELLVRYATDKGINLKKEFGTVENFNRFVIGLVFKALVTNGVPVDKAMDATFGEGAYNEVFNAVWEKAQNKKNNFST